MIANPNNLLPHFLYVILPGFAFVGGSLVVAWLRRKLKGISGKTAIAGRGDGVMRAIWNRYWPLLLVLMNIWTMIMGLRIMGM